MSNAKKDKDKNSDPKDMDYYYFVGIKKGQHHLPINVDSINQKSRWRFPLKKGKKNTGKEKSGRSNSSSFRGSGNYDGRASDEPQMEQSASNDLQKEGKCINGIIYTNEVDTSTNSYGESNKVPEDDPPLYNHLYRSSRPAAMSMNISENYGDLSSIQPVEKEAGSHFYNRLNRKRTMPIANSMGTRGFYIFASEHSYDMFKNGGFKKAQLNPEGVGIPLLQMVESYDVVAWFSKKRPIYLIYKFIIQDIDDPPPYPHSKLVLKEGQFCVYKVPFCEIYRQISFLATTYRFHFPSQAENLKNYELTDNYDYKSYGTSVDGFEMTWESSLEQSLDMWGYDLRLNSISDKILATYTTRDSDYLPKKTFKCASLYVMEESNPDALGNSSICWLTQVLACQGALLHRLMRDGL